MAHQASSSLLKLPRAAVADVSISLQHMRRICVKRAFRQVSAQLMLVYTCHDACGYGHN